MNSNPTENQFLFSLALSRMSFLSLNEKLLIKKKLDNIRELALLSIEDISLIVGRVIKKNAFWQPETVEKIVYRDAKLIEAYKIQTLCYDSAEYPSLLREIFDPPYMIYVRGNPEAMAKKCVGVVGTRRPSVNGSRAALTFACDAAKKGWTVVSGLALGIDAASHRGCIDGGGTTVAVLACGVDTVYPMANRNLGARIVSSGGCLISEYAPAESPLKYRFPQRNRIISGLSQSVVVVQAPSKSGALITADFALEQGRDVFIHEVALQLPGVENTNGYGLNRYIEDGAPIISSFDDYERNCADTNRNGHCKSQMMLELE